MNTYEREWLEAEEQLRKANEIILALLNSTSLDCLMAVCAKAKTYAVHHGLEWDE